MALSDVLLRILIACGAVSLVLETLDDPATGWINGTAILVAVSLVTLVTAFNNFEKARQFQILERKALVHCVVVRGGVEMEIVSSDLVVGDLYRVKAGDAICADAIVLSGPGVLVDESAMTGESAAVHKDAHVQPVLISGTTVLDGEASALVIAVGVYSIRGAIVAALDAPVEDTPLQIRLKVCQLATMLCHGRIVKAD
jgi:magnesium-transporting ATPase (P-type)